MSLHNRAANRLVFSTLAGILAAGSIAGAAVAVEPATTSAFGHAVLSTGVLPSVFAATPLPDAPDTGKLLIHKHEQPDIPGSPATGLEQQVDSPALEGIKFKVRKVNEVDLRTNDGWVKAGKVSKAVSAANSREMTLTSADGFDFTLGAPVEVTTNAQGLAEFANLPIGQYIVTEELTDAQARTIRPATAFAVTVPMTHPDNLNEWVYDIHVYPKNTTLSNEKTVRDGAAFAGNTADEAADVEFPVLVEKLPAPDQFDIIAIRDPYLKKAPGDGVTFVGKGVKSVTLKTVDGDVALVADTDYTVTHVDDTEGVIIKLTDAGVAKAKEARKKGKTGIEGVFLADVSGNVDGHLKNTAFVYFSGADLDTGKRIPPKGDNPGGGDPGQPGGGTPGGGGDTPGGDTPQTPGDGDPGTPTSTTVTKWGAVKVKKIGSDNANLNGAQFEVWGSHTKDFKTAQKLSINGTTTFTTQDVGNEKGIVNIGLLRHSLFADGAAVDATDAKANHYWLVETKAPTGYELLAEPVYFTVSDDSKTVGIEVVNAKRPNGSLPLTGSAAQAAIAGAAILAAGGAAFVAVRRSRKNDEK